MADKIRKLVMMANQIADFFTPYPDDVAIPAIHEHIRSFWTPVMREDLCRFAEGGGEGLRPRVAAAIERLRTPPSVIHKAVAGPDELGQATSDAG